MQFTSLQSAKLPSPLVEETLVSDILNIGFKVEWKSPIGLFHISVI